MKIIKTVNPDGTQSTAYEFSDMEEYRAYTQMEAETATPVVVGQIGAMFRSSATDNEDETEYDLLPSFDKDTPGKTKIRGATKIHTPNPPVPEGRWPDLFYISEESLEVLWLLREHTAGLTSPQITAMLGLAGTAGSSRVTHLMRTSPLIEKINGAYRLTRIGRDESLNLEIKVRPSIHNKKLGWDRFMAIPLPDGRPKRRRRRSA